MSDSLTPEERATIFFDANLIDMSAVFEARREKDHPSSRVTNVASRLLRIVGLEHIESPQDAKSVRYEIASILQDVEEELSEKAHADQKQYKNTLRFLGGIDILTSFADFNFSNPKGTVQTFVDKLVKDSAYGLDQLEELYIKSDILASYLSSRDAISKGLRSSILRCHQNLYPTPVWTIDEGLFVESIHKKINEMLAKLSYLDSAGQELLIRTLNNGIMNHITSIVPEEAQHIISPQKLNDRVEVAWASFFRRFAVDSPI